MLPLAFHIRRNELSGFLPIVSAYAARIGLADEFHRPPFCEIEVSPGGVVLAMILDTLSARSPLFRLEEFFADKDIELLPGEDIPEGKLNDDAAGRGFTSTCC